MILRTKISFKPRIQLSRGNWLQFWKEYHLLRNTHKVLSNQDGVFQCRENARKLLAEQMHCGIIISLLK